MKKNDLLCTFLLDEKNQQTDSLHQHSMVYTFAVDCSLSKFLIKLKDVSQRVTVLSQRKACGFGSKLRPCTYRYCWGSHFFLC